MRAEVTALHEDQLQEVLSRLDESRRYEHGTMSCAICGDDVEQLGLGAIRFVDGEVVAACGRLECMEAFYE
jgi:hypothetical protein